jgi:predicted ATPase
VRVTKITLQNWMNFRDAPVDLAPVTYLLGPNASGKSNFLDVFRFLRDISKGGAGKAGGGGIQNAVATRHGVPKIRCLHARKQSDVEIFVELSDAGDPPTPRWEYTLGFTADPRTDGPVITREIVRDARSGKTMLERPNASDTSDARLLTQTHLEQMQSNAAFREIADFFAGVTYLHLVPQLLKYGDAIGGRHLEGDPFGQAFLDMIAGTRKNVRDARLKKIGKALSVAVPRLQDLRFAERNKRPHLEARYSHHRPRAGWQLEEQFSDGTLRLIALLWALQSDSPMLLLEEPELSLNTEVVKQIPGMIDRVQRDSPRTGQVVISTHSRDLLSNPGIDYDGVLVIEPGEDGSTMRGVGAKERVALEAGLPISDVVLPSIAPRNAAKLSQLTLF